MITELDAIGGGMSGFVRIFIRSIEQILNHSVLYSAAYIQFATAVAQVLVESATAEINFPQNLPHLLI